MLQIKEQSLFRRWFIRKNRCRRKDNWNKHSWKTQPFIYQSIFLLWNSLCKYYMLNLFPAPRTRHIYSGRVKVAMRHKLTKYRGIYLRRSKCSLSTMPLGLILDCIGIQSFFSNQFHTLSSAGIAMLLLRIPLKGLFARTGGTCWEDPLIIQPRSAVPSAS